MEAEGKGSVALAAIWYKYGRAFANGARPNSHQTQFLRTWWICSNASNEATASLGWSLVAFINALRNSSSFASFT